jgi:hypothetical protein
MHGVRSNRHHARSGTIFAGYAVLLFDFQAHGESGSHITFGSLESKDAQAAIQFFASNAPGEDWCRWCLNGRSRSCTCHTSPEVDALVIEMVYPTIDEAVNNRLTMRLGRWSRVLTPLLGSTTYSARHQCKRSSPNRSCRQAYDTKIIHRRFQ